MLVCAPLYVTSPHTALTACVHVLTCALFFISVVYVSVRYLCVCVCVYSDYIYDINVCTCLCLLHSFVCRSVIALHAESSLRH